MHTKHHLDTPGVQAAVAAIYAKPLVEQAAIRQTIRTDLRGWLHAHLLLNSAQAAYLDSMSESALIDAGALIADALEQQVGFLYSESTPAITMKDDREPKGKEILMMLESASRIAPVSGEEDLFLIVVNYYGKEDS